jgi:mRNA interferase RelE/StbE
LASEPERRSGSDNRVAVPNLSKTGAIPWCKRTFRTAISNSKSQDLLDAIQKVIEEVEAATDPTAIASLKKMAGTKTFWRIRVGEYRIGASIEKDAVEFVRCLPRKDLYKYFP